MLRLSNGAWKSIFTILLFMLTVAYMGINARLNEMQKIISPLAMGPQVQIKEIPVPVDTSEKEAIVDYIKQVFGDDADKALLLLSCENRQLNPTITSATNDHGIFQINAYWQKIQPKFLKNPKINIEVAKQLYDENGGSFRLWSCGKRLGI